MMMNLDDDETYPQTFAVKVEPSFEPLPVEEFTCDLDSLDVREVQPACSVFFFLLLFLVVECDKPNNQKHSFLITPLSSLLSKSINQHII
jgi:hypothetical protein